MQPGEPCQFTGPGARVHGYVGVALQLSVELRIDRSGPHLATCSGILVAKVFTDHFVHSLNAVGRDRMIAGERV